MRTPAIILMTMAMLASAPAVAADTCYMNTKAGGSVMRIDDTVPTFKLNGYRCRVSFEQRTDTTPPGFNDSIEIGTCYDGAKPVMFGQFVGVSDDVIVFDGAIFRDFGACPR